jgi:hypothetical protein
MSPLLDYITTNPFPQAVLIGGICFCYVVTLIHWSNRR